MSEDKQAFYELYSKIYKLKSDLAVMGFDDKGVAVMVCESCYKQVLDALPKHPILPVQYQGSTMLTLDMPIIVITLNKWCFTHDDIEKG